MSFMEKTAWVMGGILIVAGALYFRMVIAASEALGAIAPPIIPFVVSYVVIIIIASIVLMGIVGATSPDEADAPADERERRIIDRAGHWSGYVLGFGVLVGLYQFWVREDGNLLFHICFASLMLSQIAEYALQIWFYRRGI
ncbi:MAG: hypothetical protein AAFZ91_00645 [Pseudomonadota bacterium]